jgi:GrpB-like predicted nucleotidyltransferase (UPF0157 family)
MMALVVEPHNPAWLTAFLRIRNDLMVLLEDVDIVSIEHVGSTSIPGLLAKPVIDVDIVVKPENLAAARRALVGAILPYQDLGEMGVPGRVAFRPPSINTHNTNQSLDAESVRLNIKSNIYIVLDGCVSLRNHLDLRRVLLTNTQLREEYANVKKAILAGGVTDVNEYCRGKNEVMLKILRTAGWSEDDLEEVRKANE